ncbi:peptidase C54 [Gigaspora margarita]|uniref:Cysteine protease n=1 Tax=Gigaspora margarita TaxID=4874 RepID=A0A8H3XI49_GIGMA|nr:peptidase C54 [Gigaspora margarita]
MDDTRVLSIESALVSKDPIFEENSKDLLMSNNEVREIPATHTEEFNDLDHEVSEEKQDQVAQIPRRRLNAGRNNIHNSTTEKNEEGTNEVTKRISSWFSSFWITPQETSGDASDKDDPDFANFKKGLFDSFKSESTIKSPKDNSIWLMGVRYEANNDRVSNEFSGSFYESSYYYSTPGTFPHLSMQQSILSPTNFPTEFYDDFTSRIWCTYRHNYAPIRPTNFTNDGGWGCMLRSGQSLLANALILQFLGREWRRVPKGDDTWDTYVQILTWFIDDMSSRCPFSVHRVALLGKQLGKNIGEWFGPSTASQAIKALVEDFPAAHLSVYVATDGVVYKNEVYKAGKNNRTGKDFQSVLILVAIRLGINNLNPIYYNALKECFKFPQSVGIAGGKPSSSYYFIATQVDDLYYLDPHHSRPALELKSTEEFTEEELSTFHCDTLRKIHISQLDPSMLLGFYCRTADDFEDFCRRVEEISEKYKPVFTIAQEAPIYGDDVSDLDVFSEDDEDEFEKFENDDEIDENDDENIENKKNKKKKKKKQKKKQTKKKHNIYFIQLLYIFR